MIKKKKKSRIGRNDPCPCGSGKKYKKCCLGKNKSFNNVEKTLKENKLLETFQSYDQISLLEFFASLQLFEKNHTKLIRLEYIIQNIALMKGQKQKEFDSKILISKVNKILPSDGEIGMGEDPVENLFTRNILCYGGNYIVYPGIYSNISQIIQSFLNNITNRLNRTRETHKLLKTSLGILLISNEIAKRLGHKRYMTSPEEEWREDIKLPDKNELSNYSNSVIFSIGNIKQLFDKFNISYDVIKPFLLDMNRMESIGVEIENNPMIVQPIIKNGDNYIVCLPTALLTALRHYILLYLKENKQEELFFDNYREIIWNNVLEYLYNLGFSRINLEPPKWKLSKEIKEGFFQFDVDKIAYINLIIDNAKDYKEEEPFGFWDTKDLSKKIEDRQKQIIDWLLNNTKKCENVLVITVISSIGRYVLFGSNLTDGNARFVLLSLEDLKIISQLRKCDSLTIWKYLGAEQKLLQKAELMSLSFIDKFSLYYKTRHSFYLSDNKFPNLINIVSGSGNNLRIQVEKMWDSHAVFYNKNNLVEVVRYNEELEIPIYLNKSKYGKNLELVVEGYTIPIWIISKEYSHENELFELYFDFVDMIAYWIWQITPSFHEFIEPLDVNFISIELLIEDNLEWVKTRKVEDAYEKSEIQFNSNVSNSEITFTIPKSINNLLAKNDNEGERIIIKELLKSFKILFESHGIKKRFDIADIENIINKHVPLGLKKKIFFRNINENLSLNPKNLPTSRKLQEHDIEEQLDTIVEDLGDKCPSAGEVRGKENKIKLCNSISELFYNKIKSILDEYTWESTIETIISLYEALCHEKASINISLPTSIECFPDLEKHIENQLKEFPLLDSSSLSYRTLIEIVTSEPPMGEKEISIDTLDQLLAMTYHLVNWGFISDDLYHDIFDIEISILESGRIGTKKENIENIRTNFLKAKIQEGIESEIINFNKEFKIGDKQVKEDKEFIEFEKAFLKEFGLEMTKIFQISGIISNIGFNMNNSSPSLSLSKLKSGIIKKGKFAEEDIDIFIDLFSLKHRKKWEEPPEGFDNKEIWPWLYNRKLSYARRPLIISSKPKEDPIVYWGPRHVYESINYLINLVGSGKYKLDKNSSKEMTNLIHRKQGEAGKIFTNIVGSWFKEYEYLEVSLMVPIKEGELLNSKEDLGDIDVLVLDRKNEVVYLIECKNINFARNPREIANEVEQFFKKRGKKVSWIEKHIKRDKWIKRNINMFKKVYNIDIKLKYEIISIFIIPEEIITTHIHNLPIPVISFNRLKREGYRYILNINKNI